IHGFQRDRYSGWEPLKGRHQVFAVGLPGSLESQHRIRSFIVPDANIYLYLAVLYDRRRRVVAGMARWQGYAQIPSVVGSAVFLLAAGAFGAGALSGGLAAPAAIPIGGNRGGRCVVAGVGGSHVAGATFASDLGGQFKGSGKKKWPCHRVGGWGTATPFGLGKKYSLVAETNFYGRVHLLKGTRALSAEFVPLDGYRGAFLVASHHTPI